MISNSIPCDMYGDIERQLMSMIRRKAVRLRGFMELEDAIQEARVVLFKAIQSYDFNRNPNLERFVGVCLNNAFAGQYHKMTAQCRMPRRHSRDADGEWTTAPQPPMSLEDSDVSDCTISPELGCLFAESQGVTLQILEMVEAVLTDRERLVLWAFVRPPSEVTLAPTDSGFNQAVASYLGINKNKLDWSLSRIRRCLLDVMRRPEFADHVGGIINGADWPYLATSSEWGDETLVVETIQARHLDPTVRTSHTVEASDARMCEVVYDWGEALFLRLGELAATVVMQGRFNRLSGILHGRRYGSQPIPLPWYQQCMKVIDGASAQS